MMFCKYKNLTYSSKTNKIILSDYKKVHLVAQWCVYFRNLQLFFITKNANFINILKLTHYTFIKEMYFFKKSPRKAK